MALAACRCCAETRLSCAVTSAVSFSTWVSVAVWDIISLVSIGLLGSWYFICATRSFRNVFPSRLFTALVGAAPAPVVVMPDTPERGLVTVVLPGCQTRRSRRRLRSTEGRAAASVGVATGATGSAAGRAWAGWRYSWPPLGASWRRSRLQLAKPA